MDDLFQMLFNSLPEAIGGLTVAAILAILGYFYKKLSNKKLKKFSKNNLKLSSNVANFFSIKQNTNTQVSEIPRILYVDDEIERISGFLRLLEREGFEILPATTVSQATEIIKSEKMIDLAIVDLMLPYDEEIKGDTKYEGLKVIEVARTLRGEMPIICHSAAASKEIEQKLQDLEITAHIPKPIEFPELISRVKLILLSHQQTSRQELILDEIGRRKLELNGTNPYTRIKALWALGELGHHDPEILHLLGEVEINDDNENVKKAANQARKKVQKRLKR